MTMFVDVILNFYLIVLCLLHRVHTIIDSRWVGTNKVTIILDLYNRIEILSQLKFLF